MRIELTRGQRRRMKKLAKFADRATEADRPDAGGASLKPADVAPGRRRALPFVRPDKEN